jgi:putative sterol carrier protein
MTTFKDTAEVYAVQGAFLDWITKQDGLRDKFVNANTSFLVDYSEPSARILVDCTQDPPVVTCAVGADTNAEIGLRMAADDGHRFWLGKLNLTAAMARRKVSITGSMPKALKLLPAMRPAFARYKGFLIDNGYADKVIA